MSIIFGVRAPEGSVTSQEDLLDFARPTDRYASDGTFIHVSGRVGMGIQPYYTHDRSRLESHPTQDFYGNLLSIDGRLDNRCDLVHELQMDDADIPDSFIVLKAFHRWKENCFSRLIGDWAIALWDKANNALYLARDHAGTRTLYFQERNGTLRWSTYLDTFFASNIPQYIDEEYAACFLAPLPFRHRTPYIGLRAIPPSHYLVFDRKGVRTKAHWSWFAKEQIHYKSDTEYESHFLHLFSASVRRRTAPGAKILAQLSGGIDSTSIVCMSDHLQRQQRSPEKILLDTLSYYDDTEPNWDERKYFSITETARGKVGIHIDASVLPGSLDLPDMSHGIYRLPGADNRSFQFEKRIEESVGQQGYRVILSGIGGDEVLGGVPTPLPELAGYLLAGSFTTLAQQTLAWSLAQRVPFAHLLFTTCSFAFSLYANRALGLPDVPPWLTERLRTICIDLHHEKSFYNRRAVVRPNALTNGFTWWSMMETLPHLTPWILRRYEFRYPYLDRDLIEFLYRLPREQIVRPGYRRSLMRRSLRGIVPAQILDRRRKAFISRGPITSLQRAQENVRDLFTHSLAADLGFIEPQKLLRAFEETLTGSNINWWPRLMQAIRLELWLRSNEAHSTLIKGAALSFDKIVPSHFGLASSGQAGSHAD
jgi:asparagine synthase (glutamine-hydrolysing)